MRVVSGGPEASDSASGESCRGAAVSTASDVLLSAPGSCSGGRSALTLGPDAADTSGNPMYCEGISAGGASSCDLGSPPPVVTEAASAPGTEAAAEGVAIAETSSGTTGVESVVESAELVSSAGCGLMGAPAGVPEAAASAVGTELGHGTRGAKAGTAVGTAATVGMAVGTTVGMAAAEDNGAATGAKLETAAAGGAAAAGNLGKAAAGAAAASAVGAEAVAGL